VEFRSKKSFRPCSGQLETLKFQLLTEEEFVLMILTKVYCINKKSNDIPSKEQVLLLVTNIIKPYYATIEPMFWK
jgi:hypothetical protein